MRTTRSGRLGLVTAVLLVATGCGDGGSEGKDTSTEPRDEKHSASEEPGSLEAAVPTGRYAATYVLRRTNVPGAKPGDRSRSSYTFTPEECSATRCAGRVAAPVKGTFTWNGRTLSVDFEDNVVEGKCLDADGNEVKGSHYTATTRHGAELETAKAAGEPPAELRGSYRQVTRYTDMSKDCRARRPDHHATFTLTLRRR